MLPDPELGLSLVTVADEVLLTKAIVQTQRRLALEKILDSLLNEVEQAEQAGLRLWDWQLSVSLRTKEKAL